MPCCCVPNCNNGNLSEQKARKAAGRPNPSFFKIRPEQLEKWQRAIPRADRALTTKDWVCSDHFYESDIIRYFEDIIVGDLVIKGEKRKQPALRPDAVPSKFSGPAYLNKPEKVKRKAPSQRSNPPPAKNSKVCKSWQQLNENLKDDHDHGEERSARKKATSSTSSPSNAQNNNIPAASPDGPTNTVNGGSAQNRPDTTQEMPGTVNLLPRWCQHTTLEHQLYLKINQKGVITHLVQVDSNTNELTVKVRECLYPYHKKKIEGLEEMNMVLASVDQLKVCGGNGFAGGFSKNCAGGIKKGVRCKACRASRKNERKKENRRRKVRRNELNKMRSKTLHKLRKQNKVLREKVLSMTQKLKESYKKCQLLEKSQIKEVIKTLPKSQQDAIHACLDAAKRKGPNGNRYEAEWVYECMLMRIKSPALFDHLRRHEILPLPCRSTLNRYMKTLPPIYGFQPALFEVLNHKCSSMDETDRHGNIVIDEAKVPMGVSFDRNTKKVIGLVNVGQFTPEAEKNKPGDHVLEILFQPYRGNWVQSLGVFLTRSNCKGDILASIVLEAISLSENAGLFVDGVVTDGATWNRVMWLKFGIDEDNSSCEHAIRKDCRLHFFSDWNHLIKCARNIMCPELPKRVPEVNEEGDGDKQKSKMKKRKVTDADGNEMTGQQIYERKKEAALNKQIEVPEGFVKRKHWITLLEEEEKLRLRQGIAALSYVHKLTHTHVFPDGFERMNVKMAYQFFSNSVATGMEYYKKRGVPELEDAEPTIEFIRKMNELADAMNSNGPAGAIRKDNNKIEVIKNYLEYHKMCTKMARRKGLKAFLTEETDLGIAVTLQSTIDLSDYLMEKCGYIYVMTARFNSDAIEQFFGKLRNALRQNPHPDPKIFAQIHRLLCLYSLVKPPKGSNVTGGENIKNLLSANDALLRSENERKEEIDSLLDEILIGGEVFDPLPAAYDLDHSYYPSPVQCEENLVSFMAGFTAFRQKKLAKDCEGCLLSFTVFRQETGADCEFTRMKEMYSGYSYPTPELKNLVASCEKAVRAALAVHDIKEDIFDITLRYMRLAPEDQVGCIDHKEDVTKRLIKFYLTMRMFFATGRKNEEFKAKKKQGKKLVKQSKLL